MSRELFALKCFSLCSVPSNIEQADVFLAMFHDQGLPVLKYSGFSESINITLGLSFIRTSVDHGTAYDLAGTSNIDINSFKLAFDTAVEMAASKFHISL